MKKNCISILICLLLLAGCGQGTDKATHTVATVAKPQNIVYADAKKDFLSPIEKHSWERQFAPEFVMLHFTSAVDRDPENPYDLAEIRSLFLEYDVSIHYIIDRDGAVYCYIPENRVAWHAGKGSWMGEERYENALNQYAIGIELVAIGSQEDMAQYMTAAEYAALDQSILGFTDAQYAALQPLVQDICTRYGIPKENIIGHEDYSPTKSDPGELFDWSKVK